MLHLHPLLETLLWFSQPGGLQTLPSMPALLELEAPEWAMLFLPQGNTALACPYAPKSLGHRRVEGSGWCPTRDQPQPSSTPSFAALPSGSRPKGETTSPCSSTRVLPAAACRHVLPRTQVLLLTQTAPLVCPDPLVPQRSNHGPPQALPVPISPFPAQNPKVVMGLGSAPRWDPTRKTCSEPPEGCRGWILHKRIPQRDKSIAMCQQEGLRQELAVFT